MPGNPSHPPGEEGDGQGREQAEDKADNGAQDHDQEQGGRDRRAQDEFPDVEVPDCLQGVAVLALPVTSGRQAPPAAMEVNTAQFSVTMKGSSAMLRARLISTVSALW